MVYAKCPSKKVGCENEVLLERGQQQHGIKNICAAAQHFYGVKPRSLFFT